MPISINIVKDKKQMRPHVIDCLLTVAVYYPPMEMILQLFDQPQASRKFVDLIMATTSKWANWDPGNMIKVGDFGDVDKRTGELQVKGNIYDADAKIYSDKDASVREMVGKNPPIIGSREDDFYASSMNGQRVDFNAETHAAVPGLAEASIRGQWKFNSRRGAVLIMARPQSCYIPAGTFLEDLSKVEALKGLYLVTQVFMCPTYSLYLSNQTILPEKDVVALALLGSPPIPQGPVATVGASFGAKWWSSSAGGLFRNGHEPSGKDQYAPLFNLQKIRVKERSKRGVPDPVYTGDDLWAVADPPWGLLDNDGDEEPEESYDSE